MGDTAGAPAVLEGEREIEVTYGAPLNLPTPTRAGFVFAGWKAENAETGTLLAGGQALNIAKDFTAYATWVADDGVTFTITYDLAGGNYKTGESNPTTYTTASADITLVKPVKAGYAFLGWTEGNSTEPKLNFVLECSKNSGNKTYTAQWRELNYTVKFNLVFVNKDGNNVACAVNGQSSLEDVVVNADGTLGVKLPSKSSVKVTQQYADDYEFESWVAENGTVIKSDTVFSTDLFGAESDEIVLTVKLVVKWTNNH